MVAVAVAVDSRWPQIELNIGVCGISGAVTNSDFAFGCIAEILAFLSSIGLGKQSRYQQNGGDHCR